MTPACATCGRDIHRAFVGAVETWRHAASWQVMDGHRVEPAGAPTTATKAGPPPDSASIPVEVLSSPLPLQTATD